MRWSHVISRRVLLTTVLVGITASACKETVTEPIAVASVTVTGGGGTLRLGQSTQLTTTLKSTEGWTLPNVGVSWTSSDAAKATISPSGQVTAVARGPVTLTAAAGGVTGTGAVTVIGVQSIALAPETLSVIVTQTRPMTATTVLDAGVTVTPTWRSLDTTIAKVDTAGRVTAKSTTGLARIEVTAEDKKDTAVVRVVPVPVASVTMSLSAASLKIGRTLQLIATPKDSIGGLLSGRSVGWSTSDATRATVSTNGLVTAKAAGLVTITANIEGREGKTTIDARIPIATISLSALGIGIVTGNTAIVSATARDSVGNTIASASLSWQSSDPSVATISQNGTITAIKLGSATITATMDDTSSTATVFVGTDRSSSNYSGSTTLRGQNHSGSSFAGSNFSSADLYGATFQYSDLSNSNFDGATLGNVNFTGARISGSTWVGASSNTQTKWPSGFSPSGKGIWGPDLDYTGANLSSKNFRGYDFTRSLFVGSNFKDANLIRVLFVGANLSNADLSRADLREAYLQGANLTSVTWTETIYDRNTQWPTGFAPTGRGMLGPNEDYSGRDFSGRYFYNLDFSGSNFTGANLSAANINSASLIETNFASANLQNTQLINSDLRGAILNGANLQGAQLNQAKLTGARYDASTIWPVGFDPVAAGAVSVQLKTTIAAGGYHTCAIATDGKSYCWGQNAYVGTLGNGTDISSDVPVPVSGAELFESLTLGTYGSCARTSLGKVYCWGSNWYGESGTGEGQATTIPREILGGQVYNAVVRAHEHTCALIGTGRLDCWGGNTFGQLGDGTLTNRAAATRVMTDSALIQVATADEHTCALTLSRATLCWGRGIAFGLTGSISTPTPVATTLKFVQLAVGSHSCGLTSTGEAYCWGSNRVGQLGDGTNVSKSTPVKVLGGNLFTVLFAKNEVTCGLTAAKELYCWGNNQDGGLGDGTNTNRSVPTRVSGGLQFASVAIGGGGHVCGTSTSGVAYCWGRNAEKQLGDGTTSSRLTPTRVKTDLVFKQP